MTNLVKILVSAILAVVVLPFAASAFHAHEHDVVKDARGNLVKDARNNCVYTQAKGSSADCTYTPSFTSDERNIYFDFDSSRLTARAKGKLDYIANTVLSTGKVMKATITGYADRIGNATYNRALSKRRAVAVKNYLARKGYLDTKVTTLMAKGETDSVAKDCGEKATASNIACLQPDRRVEIVFEKRN